MKSEITEYISETMKESYINEAKMLEGKTIKEMIPESTDRWVLSFTDGTSATISGVALGGAKDPVVLYLDELLDEK